MIAEHDHEGLRISLPRHPFDDRIEALVVIRDGAAVGGIESGGIGGVIRLQKPPEQVLEAVRSIEEAVEQSLVEAGQLQIEHRLALFHHDIALGQERRLVDPPVYQPGVILHHAGRVVGADALLQLTGIVPRGADRKGWGIRREVDRGGVQRKPVDGFREKKTNLPCHRLKQAELEFHLEPRPPLPAGELGALSCHFYHRSAAVAIHHDDRGGLRESRREAAGAPPAGFESGRPPAPLGSLARLRPPSHRPGW